MVRQKGTMAGATFAHKLRKAANLQWPDWLELAVVAKALLEARVVFARQSAKSLIARLQDQTPLELCDFELVDVDTRARDQDVEAGILRLKWAISAAGAVLPWRTDCLIQCLAADNVLRGRGLTPDFYLGVTKHTSSNFRAHAWLRCGGISVAGGDSSDFKVLIGPDLRHQSGTPPENTR